MLRKILFLAAVFPAAGMAQQPLPPVTFGDPAMRQAMRQAQANAAAAQIGLQQARQMAAQNTVDMAVSAGRVGAIGRPQQGLTSVPQSPQQGEKQ